MNMQAYPLHGPYPLIYDSVEDELVEDCPAVFVLGYTDSLGRFCITYVGSAGADAKRVLRNLVGTANQFKFRHYADRKAAFDHECEIFHKFMPRGNFLHPERPSGSRWPCVHCRS